VAANLVVSPLAQVRILNQKTEPKHCRGHVRDLQNRIGRQLRVEAKFALAWSLPMSPWHRSGHISLAKRAA
jgi:hypothetical protein